MRVKVEPTGCCERKGMVQVRFCMYLEPGDYGYDKHHVQVPVIPEEGYQGKVDERGSPIDIEDYNKWLDSLPKEWQNNPFHNHFIYVEPNATDKQILDIGEAFLTEAYQKWAAHTFPDLKNKPHTKPVVDNARIAACETKAQHLKNTLLERQV